LSAAEPPPVWADWPVGIRLTVRRRLPEGGYADFVGALLEADTQGLALRHRSGEVRRFERSEIAIVHQITTRGPTLRNKG
jgi:hypothetical protein